MKRSYGIVYVRKIPGVDSSFGGMHKRAARDLRIPFPYSAHSILIRRDLTHHGKVGTLQHELYEIDIQRDRKIRYDGKKGSHELTKKLEREVGKVKRRNPRMKTEEVVKIAKKNLGIKIRPPIKLDRRKTRWEK